MKFNCILFSFISRIDERDPILIPESTFERDLKTLFTTKRFADFHLVVQGKTIPCHKAILYSRCPYFQAYFTRWSSYGSSQPTTTPPSKNNGHSIDTTNKVVSTLDSNTSQQTTNANSTEIETYTLVDMDYDAVNAAIEFIYCDFVQLTWDNAVDVLGKLKHVKFL
jgi:hypothetical protein